MNQYAAAPPRPTLAMTVRVAGARTLNGVDLFTPLQLHSCQDRGHSLARRGGHGLAVPLSQCRAQPRPAQPSGGQWGFCVGNGEKS